MEYFNVEKLKKLIDEKWKELADKNVKVGGGKWDAEISTYLSVLRLIDSLQQEQPKVDLEKEIDRTWEHLEKDYSPSVLDKSVIIVSGLVGQKQFSRIAKYFYELGQCNARKEE